MRSFANFADNSEWKKTKSNKFRLDSFHFFHFSLSLWILCLDLLYFLREHVLLIEKA